MQFASNQRPDTVPRTRLAELLDAVAVREGNHPTAVAGVEVARMSNPMPRFPNVYGPNIVFVVQGRKRAYLGGQAYDYDPDHYVVFAVPLPYECEWDASADEPLLAVSLAVEPTTVGEVLVEMDEPVPHEGNGDGPLPRGIASVPITPEVGDAVAGWPACGHRPTPACSGGRSSARSCTGC